MYALLTWWLSSFSVTILSRTQVLCVTTVTALFQFHIYNWPILMFPSFDYISGFVRSLSLHLKASCTICTISFFLKNIKMIFSVLHVINDETAKVNIKIDIIENYHILLYLTITCTSNCHEWIYIQKYLEPVNLIVFNLHSGMKHIFNILSFSPPIL